MDRKEISKEQIKKICLDIRARHGMKSQSDLAKVLNVHYSTVYLWESMLKKPNNYNLYRLLELKDKGEKHE